MSHKWLDEAIFYEIYPQSFCDSNADGIGDFEGIRRKLDYIRNMGFNSIWLNPCFDSPFVDAGYDIRNYYLAASRYGTNEDLKRLMAEIHARGMHIILDLVPGHTSDQCEWFKKSALAEQNEFTDRYVWTGGVWENVGDIQNTNGFARGGTERDAAYAVNFFTAQPALNYGFARSDKPWQQSVTAPGPMATRQAMKDVMAFWLDMGCDGFRVDMAGSLVKNDDDQSATIALWQNFRNFLDNNYPDAVMISEWGQPDRSLAGGFHMDFLLHFGPSNYLDLFRTEHPYFSKKGGGDVAMFFKKYMHSKAMADKGDGLICIPSGNHDMHRISEKLSIEELKLCFAFLLSMPGVPFIYYGDEIGMRYLPDLKSVEGGYERTGSRSPMQWDHTTNMGFSSAPPDKLYIPMDTSGDAPTVEKQVRDETSLLNEVRRLIRLRSSTSSLKNRGGFKLLYCESHKYPLIYQRFSNDEMVVVVLNPSSRNATAPVSLPTGGEIIYSNGGQVKIGDGRLLIPAESGAFIRFA